MLPFTDVSKTFPDGTFALGSTTFDVAPRRVRDDRRARRGAASRRCCASPPASTRRAPGRVTVDHDSLGYVFQDATLLPWRDVRRNVELFAELDGMGKAETRPPGRRERHASSASRASRTSTRSSCPAGCGCAPRWPDRSSWSPTSSCSTSRSAPLDEITRERLNDELLGLFQRKGFGALFITHSITEAVFLSTRVLVMSAAPGPHPALVRRPVRVPALARPALRGRRSPSCRARSATPCAERTPRRPCWSGAPMAAAPHAGYAVPPPAARVATARARPLRCRGNPYEAWR